MSAEEVSQVFIDVDDVEEVMLQGLPSLERLIQAGLELEGRTEVLWNDDDNDGSG